MSQGESTPAPDQPDGLIELYGLRYGAAHAQIRERCRAVLLRPEHRLVHISHFTGGSPDFTLSTAASGGAPSEHVPGAGHLVHEMAVLDEELRPVESGDLVRVVLQGERGAMISLRLVRGQFLVGTAALDPAQPGGGSAVTAVRQAEEADRALAALANDLRATASQTPLDFGGWLWLGEQQRVTAMPDSAVAWHGDGPARESGTDTARGSGPPASAHSTGAGEPPELRAACLRHLDPADLHYVAICRGRSVTLTADVLEADELSRFFRGITVAERRSVYLEFGTRLGERIRSLARGAYRSVGHRLARVVLDVEQGALYCYPLQDGSYLLASTLDQDKVAVAEARVAQLARELTAAAHHG